MKLKVNLILTHVANKRDKRGVETRQNTCRNTKKRLLHSLCISAHSAWHDTEVRVNFFLGETVDSLRLSLNQNRTHLKT